MTQEEIVILSQLLDQKFEPVYTRLDLLESDVRGLRSDMVEVKEDIAELKQRVTRLEDKVTSLEQRVTGVGDKVTRLEDKVTSLEQRVTGLEDKTTGLEDKVTGLGQQVTGLEQRVTGLELVIENETNVNIRRIAEGHCDLVRNLREARKVDDEKELLAIRVTVLESDMSKVKHQLAIT